MSIDHGRWSIGSAGLSRIDERGRLIRDSEENVGLNLDDLTSESDGGHHYKKANGYDGNEGHKNGDR